MCFSDVVVPKSKMAEEAVGHMSGGLSQEPLTKSSKNLQYKY